MLILFQLNAIVRGGETNYISATLTSQYNMELYNVVIAYEITQPY